MKNYSNPIFVELFKIAAPVVKAYVSDLGHDTLTLSHAVAGDRFVWSPRESGTQLHQCPYPIESMSLMDERTIRAWKSAGCADFYLITVEGNVDGRAHGTIERLDITDL